MGKGKSGGGQENSKKAAGNAKKAEAAQRKQAEADAKNATAEDEYWSQGSKGKNAKLEADAAKKEEARRKKAERDAELEAEMAAASKKKPVINQKKARASGIDNALAASAGSDLYAHNIDDAISALEISSGRHSDKVDRHPERRFKPALNKYEEDRLPELRKERPGLRLNQYKQLMYEEFQKSPDNPFNQVKAAYNASQSDVGEILDDVKKRKEDKLIR